MSCRNRDTFIQVLKRNFFLNDLFPSFYLNHHFGYRLNFSNFLPNKNSLASSAVS